MRYKDLTGQKFGRLTVIKRVENNNHGRIQWLCKCSCDNKTEIVVSGNHLKDGNVKSCGCLKKEIHKKYNTYDLTGEYGIGYASNTNEPFYFDLEDYDLIKNYSWSINKHGYAIAYINKNNPAYLLHRLIIKTDKHIDHINHNKLDNRKCNLRIVTIGQNNINKPVRSNNLSGVTGVDWIKSIQKWRARIAINNKEIHLGVFDNFDDAVKARKEAEEKYFGEYSYDNSMKQNKTINVICN